MLHTVFGTAFVASGASALNQYLERDYDKLMRRTRIAPAALRPDATGDGLGLRRDRGKRRE